MKPNKFLKIFLDSGSDLCKGPIMIPLGLALFVILLGFSRVSVIINKNLITTFGISAWLFVFFLISLSVMSFIFSGLIGLSKKIGQKKKISFSEFFKFGNKFWFKNALVMLLLTIIGIIIGRVAHYGALFIGSFFELDIGIAQLVFLLIYIVSLFGLLIFLSLSNFCLIIYNLKFKESVRASIELVKENYLEVLSMSIILFVVLFFLKLIPGNIGAIIEYCLVIPYFAIVLTRFVTILRK